MIVITSFANGPQQHGPLPQVNGTPCTSSSSGERKSSHAACEGAMGTDGPRAMRTQKSILTMIIIAIIIITVIVVILIHTNDSNNNNNSSNNSNSNTTWTRNL